MNKVFLIGRLTKDPELRYTESNIPVSTFTLAINRNYSNQNGEREADFLNIVVWKKLAENVNNYLTKGSLIAVEGSIQTRNYEDNIGNKRYITEVVANSVEFLETKKENNENHSTVETNPFVEFGKQISIDPDELPFN